MSSFERLSKLALNFKLLSIVQKSFVKLDLKVEHSLIFLFKFIVLNNSVFS
jgi:hypothetical protein